MDLNRRLYRVDGPGLLSFSGGRTSAYLLNRVLDAYDGQLPSDVHVAFANTGRERAETYEFVRACSERWNVPIHWIEYVPSRPGYSVVDPLSASLNGEPYAALVAHRGYLPTPVMPMCTTELKIRPMKRWMLGLGYGRWTTLMGIRADEPRRVARLRAPSRERWERSLPLAEVGATLETVHAFWRQQTFDLKLRSHEGNCDLCFKKSLPKRVSIMAERPELAAWWAEQERRTGQSFLAATKHRRGEPTYSELNRMAPRLARLPVVRDSDLSEDDPSVDCSCHD